MNFLDDYKRLMVEAKKELNENFNYMKAYEKATQAKLIAEKYLNDKEKVVTCKLYQGLAYLGIDPMRGHDYLQNLYIDQSEFLSKNARLKLLVKTAFARAKNDIGEYDEAIFLFKDIIKYFEEKNKNFNLNSPKKGLMTSFLELTSCQIHKYRNNCNLSSLNNLDRKDLEEEEIRNALDQMVVVYTNPENEFLEEIETLAKKASKFAQEHGLEIYETLAIINNACVMIDRGNLEKAKGILLNSVENSFVLDHSYGNILNEIALINLYENDLESAKNNLDKAWHWLMVRKDKEEISRNCFLQGLYWIATKNYLMAYASAELGFSHKEDMGCLKILYLISKYKSLVEKKRKQEEEYINYQYNHQKYKNILKERVR